jgi:guanylate kinase
MSTVANSSPGPAQGQLYIISAPSGAGKTSLVHGLTQSLTGVEISVSYTTRPRRRSEQEGINYHFVDQATFDRMHARAAFLEHATVFGYSYGTSRSAVLERLNEGIDVILEIDWQGALQVRRALPRSVSIFILPPSRRALEERLQRRDQDSPDVIAGRLREAVNEMAHYAEFDYLVVNDNFEAALAGLCAIVTAQRLSQIYQSVRLAPLVHDLLR